MRRAIIAAMFNRHGFRYFQNYIDLGNATKSFTCPLFVVRLSFKKYFMIKLMAGLLAVVISSSLFAQNNADLVKMSNIGGIKVFLRGDQMAYPIIGLNTNEQIELHFDDLDGKVKNYNATLQLCNADWSPADLSTFDYLRGFSNIRLNQYRVSSGAFTRYIHYQAVLPDRNCVPTKSGNYLLKVYLDGDTGKLAFTRRVLVVERLADVAAQILQPFNSELFRTHQKVQFSVSKSQMNVVNPIQQIRAVILQNDRWDNAVTNLKPTFIRGNMLEFNAENDAVFAAGKEFRWADLRSFRFRGTHVAKTTYDRLNTEVYIEPDPERSQQRYVNFKDFNGHYFVESGDSDNPWWQGDYGNVHFTFVPNNNQPYPDKKVYLVGEMNQYNLNDTAAMNYNAELGIYEKTLFLKQGYYSYTYVTKDAGNRRAQASVEQTDGNSGETENDYTVLIYYRSLAGRHDELVGVAKINSLNSRRIGF